METKGWFATFLEKEIKVTAGNGQESEKWRICYKKHLHFSLKGKICFISYMDEQLMQNIPGKYAKSNLFERVEETLQEGRD